MAVFPIDPDRIVLAGDWHGDPVRSTLVVERAASADVHTVVQVGDFGYWGEERHKDRTFLNRTETACERHGVMVVFVKGNHEDHDALDALTPDEQGLVWIRPHIVYVPNGARWTWNGVRFLALGGAHSMLGLGAVRRVGVDWFPQETISESDVAAAIDGPAADVVIAHDAPDAFPSPTDPTGDGWPLREVARSEEHRERLGMVVDACGARAVFHGHLHRWHRGLRHGADGLRSQVLGLACNLDPLVDNTCVYDLARGEVRDLVTGPKYLERVLDGFPSAPRSGA